MPNAWCFVSLDATDCPIQEPSPFSTKWYSHKLEGAGLKYEVGLCIRTGEIVWVYGGVPCGKFPDLKLARERYIHEVSVGEKTIADKGYRDNEYFIHPKIPNTTVENARLQKQIMARHETLNGRLKSFAILTQPYRHDKETHRSCFYAVANIVQLMLLNGEPLYDINNLL